jgi:hypothetical protein
MTQGNGRRFSPALVVSVTALVLAGTGTAFGSDAVGFIAKAVGLSSKQKKQVTSIADRQISTKAPGLSVLNATHATTATNATNASNAANATDLDGQPASTFEPSADIARSGLITLAAGGSDRVQVASFGPFTLKLGCGPGTESELYVTSSATTTTAFITGLSASTPTSLTAGATIGFLGGGSGSLQINTTIATFVTGTSEYLADLTVGQDLPSGAADTCFANAVINPS